MAKALKTIGMIAGAVALVATGVGAFAAAGSAIATTASTVATYATLAAGVANVGATVLQKPPPARGSVTSVVISPDAPMPYAMGEGVVGGVVRYMRGYGPTLNKVPNPYRFVAMVVSGAGPIESLTPHVDQGAIGSWYSGFLYTQAKLGACPDTALTPQWSGAPGWDSASKLSGKAAVGFSLLFDKDGKRFASGMPQLGAYGKFVKVYDPRLDSTFAGGSGACRLGNEATYVWSENPALHAGTYAYGRWQNGKRVMGIGIPGDAIDWACVAAWANVCDANGWRLFGIVYEPGDKFANLRDICIAGGAEPILRSAPLAFHYSAPRVALDTITAADIVRTEERSVIPNARWTERINTVFARYRSPAHNWELVQTDPIAVSSYVALDGETKQAEWPFNLVKDVGQAVQLARYRLEDSREMQPIVLPCHPRLRAYRPGDCLHLDLAEEIGVASDAVIIKRRFDPATMVVWLTLKTETAGKHGYALGQTGSPPPTPALAMTGQSRDEMLSASLLDDTRAALLLAQARGKLTVGGALPAVASSNVGDTHVADDGTFYDRVNEAGILLDGKAITLAGYRPRIGWTKSGSQPLFTASQVAMAAEAVANSAINALDDLADDGLLSINEKIVTLIPENSRLEGAWSALSAAAATAAVPTTTASAKRAAWIALRDGLTPAWNDVTADTPVTRATYRAALVDYDQALEDLNKAVIEGMTAAKQVTVAPPAAATIYCDYTGAPKSGQLPRVLTPAVTRGGSDIRTSADVTYSISAPTQLNASVNSTGGSADKGRVTIGSSFTGPGTVSLTVTVSGVAYGPYPVAIDRVLDSPPNTSGGGGAGPAYDYTFNPVTVTGFSAISDELGPLTLASGQKLVVTAPLDYEYQNTTTTGRYLTAKAQYWDGSAWQDFPSSPVNGSVASWNQSDLSGSGGSINLSQEKTGLGAGTYKVRLVAGLSAAGGTITVSSGVMTYSIQ